MAMSKKRIQKVRLERLYHFLEVMKQVPKAKFDISVWKDTEAFEKARKVKVPENFGKVDCRTAACAIGWLTMDKKVKRQGLKLEKKGLAPDDYSPRYKGAVNMEAIAEFFHISYEEAGEIADPEAYVINYAPRHHEVTPAQVRKRIRSIIKKYENGRGDMQLAQFHLTIPDK